MTAPADPPNAPPRLSAKREFGDYQTPAVLADAVCGLLHAEGIRPASVLEPTCGVGRFLIAAAERFGRGVSLRGFEIDPDHARRAAEALAGRAEVTVADFFSQDWTVRVRDLPRPFLILGNPPWVTNSALGAGGGRNLPAKSNAERRRGIDAVTGKANFDVCEFILRRLFEAADGGSGTVAMLCKAAVARRVLAASWRAGRRVRRYTLHGVDAGRHFDANVDAVLLTARFDPDGAARDAAVYGQIGSPSPERILGWADGRMVADADAHARATAVCGGDVPWRSGVKHDAAKVMELTPADGGYRNGFGERIELEADYLYPLLKSSDVAAGRSPRRALLVPQRHTGETTADIAAAAPRTWAYLQEHGARLDARRSSIYRGRPRFAVFGVGDYAFTPWKVAVSGFYKTRRFRVVGPAGGRPVVFDDTVYFLPFRSEAHARAAADALASPAAEDYFRAFAFRDAKRPVTAELLRGLDLARLGVPGVPSAGRTGRGSSRSPDRAQRALFPA